MNTSQPCLLRVEVVGDLPVLWATFQRLDLPATLDRHFPAPLHWKGPLTPGAVLALWCKGAVVALYVRLHPTLSDSGSAYADEPARPPHRRA